MLALSLVHAPVHAAEGIEVRQAQLEPSDEGYKLSAVFAFELNPRLEGAILLGMPLSFTTDVEIIRPRRFWFDEKTITASHTIRISYNVLTRQYRVATAGGLQQNFTSLDDALSLVKRPSRWIVAEKGALKPGNSYTIAVRMQLDAAHLSKPMKVHVINDSDWQLSSDWKHFSFKVETK